MKIHLLSLRAGPVRGLLLLLMLAGFALRTTDLTLQNIWWDEARNIDVALRPFWQIPTAPELDIHPPLYFWLLHSWLWLLGVEWGVPWPQMAFAARLLSVAAGTVGVALLFHLARRSGGARTGPLAGLLAALLGALSPFWLAESQEARMYTAGFALLTAAAIFFLRAGVTLPLRSSVVGRRLAPPIFTRHSVLFTLFSAAALLTHYNAAFILAAWYGWWGLSALLRPDRWQRLARVLLHGLALTLLVLPVAPIALRQIPGYANPNLTVPSLWEYFSANWAGYLGGYAWNSDSLAWLRAGGWWLWAVLAAAVVGSGLLAGHWWRGMRGRGGVEARTVRRRPTTDDRRQAVEGAVKGAVKGRQGRDDRSSTQYATDSQPSAPPPFGPLRPPITPYSLLITWLFAGLALYYIAVVDRGAFNIRYASFVTPALYALVGLGLAGLGRVQRWLPLAGLALLALGLLPAARADLTDARFFREDTAGLAGWLRAQAGPEDLIFVDQKYPFGLYYQRYAIAPDAAPTGPEAAPARYLFVDINAVDQRLTAWAGDAQRIFWVEWFESDTDPRGSVAFLLDKYGEQAGEQLFRGYRVRWWQMKPPTEFALAQAMQPLALRWRGGLETLAIDLPPGPLAAGAELPVVIRWRRTPGQPLPPLKARVALYDGDARLAQDDRRLLNDRHLAPAEWQPGDAPLNVSLLSLPGGLPPGAYSLRLLVYNAGTLAPIELLDAAGNPAGIEAEIGRVEIGK